MKINQRSISPGSEFFKSFYEKKPGEQGKSSYIINIKCNGCRKCKDQNDFSNNMFIKCITSIIEIEKDSTLELVQIEDKSLIYKKNLADFIECIETQKECDLINENVIRVVNTSCARRFNACLIESISDQGDIRGIFSERHFLAQPVVYHEHLKKIRSFLYYNSPCMACIKIPMQSIDATISRLEKTVLLRKMASEGSKNQEITSSVSYHLLNQSILINPVEIPPVNENEKKPIEHVNSYHLDPKKMIEIRISAIDREVEKFYQVLNNFPFSDDFFQFLKKEVEKDLEADPVLISLDKFENVIRRVITLAKQKLMYTINGMDESEVDFIALLTCFSILGMEKILPLLIDSNIEEIFLDTPTGTIYLHHAIYHHCKTSIRLSSIEIERIISRMRLETDKNLNQIFPTLKCVFKNDLFHARFNVDVDPLNPLGFSLDIRRLNNKVYNILDLHRMHTFNIDIAAFLVFCLHARLNLTIMGRTDSGKTTLLNALDFLYPKHLRKVYVEDEIETVAQDQKIYHQLKFQATNKHGKTDLIKNLLHRSPDVLVLGELLTRDETEALFHCLSTGMRGLQTIHSNSPRSLLTRFQIHFGIDVICFQDLDYLITMQKFENGERKIVDISEVILDQQTNNVSINSITTYNPKMDKWHPVNYLSSHVMRNFVALTRFDNTVVEKYLGAIKNAITQALASTENGTVVDLINQVYMAFRDYF